MAKPKYVKPEIVRWAPLIKGGAGKPAFPDSESNCREKQETCRLRTPQLVSPNGITDLKGSDLA